MKKTVALFGTAAGLLAAALAFDLWSRLSRSTTPIEQTPTPTPSPPTPAPSPLVGPASGESTLTLGDAVALDAALSNGYLKAGENGELFMRVLLKAREDVEGRVRAPMALAIVIDRSGSMAGEKMERAREAAKQLVSRLEDRDQVAIISYATDYSVDVPLVSLARSDRARLLRVIDQIYDGGGTNLSGGLEAGLAELRRAEGSGLVSRLVLISDGNANQGITDPRTLAKIAQEARQSGRTVSTVGFGLDFNEDVMTVIAESGGGAYHYVRDAEQIAHALDDEFKGLAALAARAVEVGLALEDGVVVREVFGYRTESRGGRLVIPVGDMASGETRRIFLRLGVTASTNGVRGISGVTLAYLTAEGDVPAEFGGALSVGVTDDQAALRAGERPEVAAAAEAVLAAEARKQAASSFQSGNKAGAMQRLGEQLRKTRARAATLNSPALNEAVRELEDAERAIQASDAASDEGKDLIKREKYRARQIFVY
jgi:Ca-activated chloride channel family protein